VVLQQEQCPSLLQQVLEMLGEFFALIVNRLPQGKCVWATGV
jgi:hypothetical protein